MKTIKEIKNVLSKHKGELEQKYKIRKIGIFGDYVKGRPVRKTTIDILVDFEEPIGIFEFMDLEKYFEDLLKTEIDLVSKDVLKTQIGKYILDKIVYI
ncbi:nucleotidyltransferase family protein [bacterium]|nr:nucleotidyltransferase family protein [bacterium]